MRLASPWITFFPGRAGAQVNPTIWHWRVVGAMNGVLGFKASYRTEEGLLSGNADVFADSLTIKGRTLTDVRAAVVYNPEERTFASRDFSARLYGGRISGDAEIIQPETGDRH